MTAESKLGSLVMPRRSLFLLAAAVVMLYFLIIMFMLSPLSGSKNVYYGHGYMNHFSYRQLPTVNWCKELHWQTPPSPHATALVSFPGSGNTWLRYLLQQATGIVTGSVYMDHSLRVHGFPAENVTDGSVLVVKTHEAPPIEPDKFKSAILLIRNPRDAILADFNRLHKGHIGTAPKSAFMKKSHEHKKSDWATYVSQQLVGWESLHRLWLARFPGAVLVLRYEALVADPRRALQGIFHFMNITVSDFEMNCAISHKEGIYRRKKKLQDFDPFTPEMYKAIDAVRNKVLSMVSDYQKKHDETVRQNTAHVGKNTV